jgi:hypothetical protein
MQPLQQALLSSYEKIQTKAIINPKARDILRVAPYMAESEASQIVVAIERDANLMTRIVGPPISVQGALNIFTIRRCPDGIVRLSFSFTTRRRESYPRAMPTGRCSRYEHQEAAQNYASERWGNLLVWDRSADVLVSLVLGGPAGFPCQSGTAWLSEKAADVLAGSDEPASQLLDDAIQRTEDNVVCATWSPIVGLEMRGHYLHYAAFFCGKCAGGVGDAACFACGASYFEGMERSQPPTTYPMPRTLSYTCPHHFAVPTQLSRLSEAEAWVQAQRQQYLDVAPHEGRYQRVIQLDEEKDAS